MPEAVTSAPPGAAATAASPAVSGPGVDLAGVVAGFRGGPAILNDLNLALAPGSFALLTGPSGAGKSAILHLLRGALPVRQGQAQALGVDLARLTSAGRARFRRRLGYVAGAPLLIESATVFENVSAPLLAVPGGEAAVRKRSADIADVIAFGGLKAEARAPVARLSGAQRQLVAVLRALVRRPELLLLDQPDAGLAPEMVQRMLRLVTELARQGAIVVMAAQDPALRLAPGMKILRVSGGRVAEDLGGAS